MPDPLINLAQEGKINQNASLRDSQSVIINASQEDVWNLLVDMDKWPTWNPDIQSVSVDKVEEGSTFTWKAGGTKIRSKIRKLDAPNEIAWTGRVLWIKAIHVWKFEKTEDYQTIVSSQESMQGFLLPIFISHYRLHSMLTNWLARLKEVAEDSAD